mmetsp:Transcript_42367/g.111598  ORF Transcript_42367/g.111598 Transcript_42367/m.111598 type:complete len:346 (+) Transcript_42367:31-1068(+)
MATLSTPLTKLLGIQHPVMSAGMASVAGHELAAAVSNAGGIGTIGGLMYNVKTLRQEIQLVKEHLRDPSLPFGVDLLIPKVGEGARKTNYDYTGGKLDHLIDVIIDEKVKLFVCAVGVPPKWAVEKLHQAGVVCMNMIGAPQHVGPALDVGMDILCAQGTEAGGHTGDIATLPLIPICADLIRGKTNFFGTEVVLVAAGGIFDGRGLGASLCLGASGVWCGTRFIACEESAASAFHRKRVVEARAGDTTRSIVFTGRPARVLKTPYVQDWAKRTAELETLTSQGKVPFVIDLAEQRVGPAEGLTAAMGQAAGGVREVLTAEQIVVGMTKEAAAVLGASAGMVARL